MISCALLYVWKRIRCTYPFQCVPGVVDPGWERMLRGESYPRQQVGLYARKSGTLSVYGNDHTAPIFHIYANSS